MWNRRKRRIENKTGKGAAGIVIDNVTIPAVFCLSGKQNLISVAILKKIYFLCNKMYFWMLLCIYAIKKEKVKRHD